VRSPDFDLSFLAHTWFHTAMGARYLSRRVMLRRSCLGLGWSLAGFRFVGWPTGTPAAVAHHFQSRGVVLVPEDLSLTDWPERAKRAGLTTIGLHHSTWPQEVIKVVQSDQGQRFLVNCRELGLEVEYELHAMRHLLPRELFAKNKTFFRMNDQG